MSKKIHNLHATICKYIPEMDSFTQFGFKIKVHEGFAIFGSNYLNTEIKRLNHSELRVKLAEIGVFESVIICTHGEMTSYNKGIYTNTKNKSKSQSFKKINDSLKLLGVNKTENIDEFHFISLDKYPTLFSLIK